MKIELDKWIQEVFQDGITLRLPLKEKLFSQQSQFQKVEIFDTSTHGRVLLNDGCFMTSERDEFIYHEMMTHVPLFAHARPENVLIIGGGDAGTAREVLTHSSVQSCALVEIDSVVVDACREFFPGTSQTLSHPKLKLHIEDGIEFLRKSDSQSYDVILVDSTDPVGPAQPLFGGEFYRDVARVLKPGGIVVAQGESPFYNEQMQKSLLSNMGNLFKNVSPYNFTNMTYPGGLWSFIFASQEVKFWPSNLDEKIQNSGHAFKYYNSNIHKSAFALPTFMVKEYKNLIKES